MKYLIVQDWSSTRGNHAGMEHMCDMLVEKWPETYAKICKLEPQSPKYSNSCFFSKLKYRYDIIRFRRKWISDYMLLCQDMFEHLKSGDEVFLLEYNWPSTTQLEIAKYIRKNFSGVKIRALSHITPTLFKRLHAEQYILEWSKYVDTEMTLGTSLSKYFAECGVALEKISTGFHYVDSAYYNNSHTNIVDKGKITIIAIGALQRDFQLIAEVVNSTPEVNWIICRGRKAVDDLFKGDNVRLIGFVPEEELRDLMRQSDLSLNILEDTVGSNVITTSMAMGLGIIVSDVGSIRDYCDNTNACFCHNTKESFVECIKALAINKNTVINMRLSSLHKIDSLSINHINNWFNSL